MHETPEEAIAETERMLGVYAQFCEESLAIPVLRGRKTEKEKFAGAEATYCIEAMMHDGKALQAGTSHYFGDGFAKAFEITFQGRDNKPQFPYQTSWGVSTRLIGGIIMTHGDDSGLVLPPAVAPVQVIVVPVAQHKPGVSEKAEALKEGISAYCRADIDLSDNSPGWKFAQYEMKGVPLRLEIGPRDIEKGQCVLVRRDTREKAVVPLDSLQEAIPRLLGEIHDSLLSRALQNRKRRTHCAGTMEELLALAGGENGYIKAMWCGDRACEDKLKEQAGITSRCIPFEQEALSEHCICCGKPARHLVYWGKAY